MRALLLSCVDRENIFNRPLAKVKHIKAVLKRKNNNRKIQ